jgi:hypothetical protein
VKLSMLSMSLQIRLRFELYIISYIHTKPVNALVAGQVVVQQRKMLLMSSTWSAQLLLHHSNMYVRSEFTLRCAIWPTHRCLAYASPSRFHSLAPRSPPCAPFPTALGMPGADQHNRCS